MVYTFGLVKHANIRYRDSLIRLGRYELTAMLHALSLDCDVKAESAGGADFLTFRCRNLSEEELSFLSGHSTAVFFAEKTDSGLLRPVDAGKSGYLGEDLPEILKYKGKTSTSFLRLMINVARSVSGFSLSSDPLTVIDPVCGKGTACFCAVQSGMNSVGLDLDRKAVHEACDYFSRYLKINMLKHTCRKSSETAGNTSLPVVDFVFADTREHYILNRTRFLRLATGDTEMIAYLCRRFPGHLLIADLPYGVQHAPQFGAKPESFSSLFSRALPAWKKALLPGGVAAVSYNTLTFPTIQVSEIARSAGWIPCKIDFCTHFCHEVEQAVVRDVIFLINR